MNPVAPLLDGPTLTLLEEHVRHLLVTMSFNQTTIHCRLRDGRLRIEIEAGDDGKLLIGAQGANLAALQHIVRCILRRQVPDLVVAMIDVNGYQARREQGLVDLAELAAKRAEQTGRVVMLKPMSPADRRVIHTHLAERGDVATESTGEEPNRKIVIKPVLI